MTKEQSTQLEPGEAWARFCDQLKDVGRLLDAPGCPQDSLNRALGFRAITHWLRAGLEMGVDYSNPSFPSFYRLADETKKMGNDNPDNIYFNCVIDGELDYIIRGNAGTIDWFSINAKASAAEIGGMRDTGSIDSTRLDIAENGDFLLHISASPKPGNWLQVAPDSRQLIVRQTFGDRAAEQPATMEISCENPRVPHNTPDAEAFVAGLEQAMTFVRSTTEWTNEWMDIFRGHSNQLPDDDQLRCIQSGGDPDIRYYQSHWSLAEDEALVIRLRDIPECHTWNFQLSNYWMESLDYRFFRVCINKHTAHYEEDGSVTIVVAGRSPGPAYPNWLYTAGHAQGSMLGRLVKAREFPGYFATEVVKLDALQA